MIKGKQGGCVTSRRHERSAVLWNDAQLRHRIGTASWLPGGTSLAMSVVTRRALFLGGAALGASYLEASQARATLVRGLSLQALVERSERVIVLRPLESYSHYVELGGRRSIVTDTRVRVEEVIAKRPPRHGELLVRTLGGRVGRVGELVHGQAELEAGGVSLAFLKRDAEGAHWVMGMAQGHYPIQGSLTEGARLTASRNLPEIRDWHASAVRDLTGQELGAARSVIRKLSAR
jgi:hypothetical protein